MQEIMGYENRKEEIRKRLRETAENFVYIGYQLKMVRESREYEQDGYSDILEFAQKEYGLHKDDTYRFIRINDKYSIGGNSPELAEPFKGMAQTKLSEMLSLPDGDLGLITPETTREDIRELKRFNNQANEEIPEKAGSDLQNIIMDFFRPAAGRSGEYLHRLLLNILSIVRGEITDPVLNQEEQIQECINPKGNGVFRAGRYIVFLYDVAQGMKYKSFGDSENHALSYMTFAKTTHLIFTSQDQGVGLDFWESAYGIETELDKVPLEDAKREQPEQEFIEAPELEEVLSDSDVKEKGREYFDNYQESNNDVDNGEQEKKDSEKPESYPQVKSENSEKAPAQLGAADRQVDLLETSGSEKEEVSNETEENQHCEARWQQEQVSHLPITENGNSVKQLEIENFPEFLPDGYIKCHDGSEIQETETYKRWRDIQSSIIDLHTQILDREEPGLESSRKLGIGVNHLKMLMDEMVSMKEEI